MPFRRVVCLLPLFFLVSGCHHYRPPGSPVAKGPPRPGRNEHAPVPIGHPTLGSTVALARMDKRRVAFVSDSDLGAIRRFDLDDRSELPPIPMSLGVGPLLV